jgi:hypothetical protein
MDRSGPIRCLKLDTYSPCVLTQAGLDPFAGSGTTVIAAEKTGRHARVIEYDPGYCDVIVCRWQKYTGKTATLDGSNRTFEDIETERAPFTEGKLDSGGAAPTPGSVLP